MTAKAVILKSAPKAKRQVQRIKVCTESEATGATTFNINIDLT
ncbi:hypothetical protein [Lysinibacillus sp. TE18511]